MPPATRCKMMLALLLAALALAPSSHAGWETSINNKVKLYLRSSSLGELQVEQLTPSQRAGGSNIADITSYSAVGNLITRDPATNAVVRLVEVFGGVAGGGGMPPLAPALSTPDYTNPGATTTLQANLDAVPVQACVTILGASGEPDCKEVLLDFTWAATGVRVGTNETSQRVTNTFYNPSSSTIQTFQSVGTQYTASNDARVRVVDAGTGAVLFDALFECDGPNECPFEVAEEPFRRLSRN